MKSLEWSNSLLYKVVRLYLKSNWLWVFKQWYVIISVAKKQKISCLNDDRPMAATSAVMKCFKQFLLQQLKVRADAVQNHLQFAYRANWSIVDAINLAPKSILQHWE